MSALRGIGYLGITQVFVLVLSIACLNVPLASSAPRKRAGALYSQWTYAHATFYGGFSGKGTKSGACGYLDVFKAGYGKDTVATSSALWRAGHACGGCMQVICINTKTWRFCNKGYPNVIVTVTNMCPQDWSRETNRGGWCNNPRKHLDMSMHAYLKIAQYRAGIVPIIFRRVPCEKKGGIVFAAQGNYWWLEINIQNVAGSGDLQTVYYRRSGGSAFRRMVRSWGATYSRFGMYVGVSLDIIMHSLYTDESLYIPNALPRGWKNGRKYQSRIQFPISTSFARKLIAGEAQFDPQTALGKEMTNSDDETMDSGSKLIPDMVDQKFSASTSDDPLDASLKLNSEQDRLYPNSSDIVDWESGVDVDEEIKLYFLN